MQAFPRQSNYFPLALALGVAGALTVSVVVVWYYFSPKFTQVGYVSRLAERLFLCRQRHPLSPMS